jgi:hypothetical protein
MNPDGNQGTVFGLLLLERDFLQVTPVQSHSGISCPDSILYRPLMLVRLSIAHD